MRTEPLGPSRPGTHRRRLVRGALVLLVAGLAAIAVVAVVAARPDEDAPDTLGVYATQPSAAEGFAAWLGRPPVYVVDFLPFDRWSDIDGDAIFARWEGAPYRMVFSVPMLPRSGASLARGAAGAYDGHFRAMARALVAHGHEEAIIRLGWEMNGDWFPWSITGGAEAYAAYWRRIMTAMREVAPGLRFDFCPANGSSLVDGARLDPSAAYPGDAYVDVIGMDLYDQSWFAGPDEPAARWRGHRVQPYGLDWHRRFARERGKPVSFPEWGLLAGGSGRGGGDNPAFIAQMHAWIADGDVLYQAYFNADAPDGNHLITEGAFPRSAATFRRLFGPG